MASWISICSVGTVGQAHHIQMHDPHAVPFACCRRVPVRELSALPVRDQVSSTHRAGPRGAWVCIMEEGREQGMGVIWLTGTDLLGHSEKIGVGSWQG